MPRGENFTCSRETVHSCQLTSYLLVEFYNHLQILTKSAKIIDYPYYSAVRAGAMETGEQRTVRIIFTDITRNL